MNRSGRQEAIRSLLEVVSPPDQETRKRRAWKGSVFAFRNRLILRLRNGSGKWVSRSTGLQDTPENRILARATLDKIRQGDPIPGPPPAPPKVKRPKNAPSWWRSNGRNKSLKRRRGAACEVCGWMPRPPLRDTACNAHHVRPRAEGGDDSDDNRIILCPNHHAVAHALHRATPARDRAHLVEQLRGWDAAAAPRAAASL
jgi:hypothetical protein